jgi:hypothetical protein
MFINTSTSFDNHKLDDDKNFSVENLENHVVKDDRNSLSPRGKERFKLNTFFEKKKYVNRVLKHMNKKHIQHITKNNKNMNKSIEVNQLSCNQYTMDKKEFNNRNHNSLAIKKKVKNYKNTDKYVNNGYKYIDNKVVQRIIAEIQTSLIHREPIQIIISQRT